MKETYLTSENIDSTTREYLEELAPFRRGRRPLLAPGRLALLVVDMQRYFFSPASRAYIPSAPAIVPRVRGLIRALREAGCPVIFTAQANGPGYRGPMLRFWREVIRPDDPRAELIEEIGRGDEPVVFKEEYDAFYRTDLDDLIKKTTGQGGGEASGSTADGPGQLIVCGVMTHLCCETTVRSAFVRGFEVFFPVDATATYNERFHRSTLFGLAHGFTLPVGSAELVEELRQGGGGWTR